MDRIQLVMKVRAKTGSRGIITGRILPDLVLTGHVPVYAEDPTYSFTVNQEDTGYTYSIYQIFAGDASTNSAGEAVLSNIEWGDGVKDDSKTQVYAMFGLTGENKTAAKVAEAVAAASGNVFHTIMSTLTTKNGASLQNGHDLTYDSTNKNYSISNLEPGYYLVRNTVVPAGATYSDYLVAVLNKDVSSDPKVGTPTSEKKTQDKNDSTDLTAGTVQDSADYDIGNTIPYTLTATLPTNYANYAQYRLNFVDDISAGLSWDGTATIYYGASDTTGSSIIFTDVTDQTKDGKKYESSYTGGKVLRFCIDDLKAAAPSLAGGDTITIRYNATLNANAKIGSEGNPNKYNIEFSNNPTNTADVTTTPPDLVIVFTYKTVFNKVDASNNPLTGADFKLEKKVRTGSGEAWVDVTELNGSGNTNPTKTGDTTGSTFAFSGLDDGDYRLTEITTPTGYNTIDPIEFTITAEHTISGESPALTSLTGTDGAEFTMTADLSAGSLTANIVNNSGTVLPSTGGSGTTIFYVAGLILVLGAAVILIVRRKADSD